MEMVGRYMPSCGITHIVTDIGEKQRHVSSGQKQHDYCHCKRLYSNSNIQRFESISYPVSSYYKKCHAAYCHPNFFTLVYLVGGAILVENVFSYPGLGLLMREAVLMHDYPLIQGIFLLVTVWLLTANYLADWVYGWLDPRVCIGKTKMFLHIN